MKITRRESDGQAVIYARKLRSSRDCSSHLDLAAGDKGYNATREAEPDVESPTFLSIILQGKENSIELIDRARIELGDGQDG